ncbi:SubName: Full=Uncharacterized protein {ECO:0000313/EMBL:CCA67371.1} [Serendipita indica DSM 11827]|nr:SubName: Full=Uncharacterized protein {ECO:0000313/EMBL:CCA67371.1} [Serendipita indica DSM 11827]
MDFGAGSSASAARRAQPPNAMAQAVTYTTMATGRSAPKRSYADHDMSQASMSSYAAQTSDQARSGSSMASSSVLNPHRHHHSRAIPSAVGDHLEMNDDAPPARPKRQRPSVVLGLGPLSAGPSMPAGGSVRTNPLTSTSTSTSMAHVDQDHALWMSQTDRPELESTNAARASNAQSSLGTARDSLSRILSHSLLDFEDSFEPMADYRTNRMSWFPDDAAANNTITTNTEPGWNLTAPLQEYAPDVSSTRPRSSRSLRLDTDGANQSYSSSLLTSELPQPMERMTNPGANLANNQAQESRLFYSQSDSDSSIPSPMEWALHEVRSQPAQANTNTDTSAGSWWPTQWSYSASRNPTLESWDQNPTSRPQYWDLPALPPVPPPRPTLSNVQARSVRFQEDAPRRLHSPPPPQTSSGSRLSGIQSLLDRYTRRTSGVGEGSRAGLSHSRSASEGSRNVAHGSGSGTSGNRDLRNRRAERVESWVETSRPSGRPETIETLDPFPTTNGSFYDHPSMRDIVSSHSEIRGPRQGRERGGSGFYDHPIIPAPILPSQEDLSSPVEHSQPARSRAQRPVPPRPTWNALRPQTPIDIYTRPEPNSYYGNPFPTPPPVQDSPPAAPHDPFDWSTDPRPWTRPRRDESPDQGRLSRLLGEAWFGMEDEFLVVPSIGVEEEPTHSTVSRRSAARTRRRPLRTVTLSHVTHRMRVMGDYVLDDDFDDSYEALMALTQHVGPVKRGCSQKSLEELPSGTYKEFSEGATEKVVGDNGNCAICLEDYQPEDACMKLPRCSHFYHKDCVKEWLKSAKTCPVCRETVEGAPRSESSPARRPSFLPRPRARDAVIQRIWDETTAAQPGPSTVTPRRSAARRRMTEDISVEQGADLARQSRRDRAPRRISRPAPTLGEYDDPWPGFSPPSPEPSFALHAGPTMATHTTTTETSARFIRGPLAQALRETSDLRLRY